MTPNKPDSIYALTDEVLNTLGEDLLLAMTGEHDDVRVSIDLIIKHDVINKHIYGSVIEKGIKYFYSVEDGNINGTVFHDFSTNPVDIPKTRIVRIAKIVPLIETPLSLKKADAMKNELSDIARNMSYDAYVTGGSDKTTNYWHDKIKKLGGKVIYEEMEIPV
jgi:hypothetical protein